jgi:hypothetical protein
MLLNDQTNENRSRSARWRALVSIAVLAIAGCGDDAAPGPAQPQDAGDSDAQRDSSAASEAKGELEASVTGLFSEFDGQVRANCPCFVEMGAYASVDECLMWQGSREDWVPCTVSVLAKYDSPETREALNCVREQSKALAECVSTKSCDPTERAECAQSPLQCLMGLTEFALALGMECPDLTLLPRQSAK